MKNDFNTSPLWLHTAEFPSFPALDRDLTADVVIVGGGLTGLQCALMLLEEGIKPVVVDATRIGRGTSGHTTAKITAQHDIVYNKFIKRFGQDKTRKYAQSNQRAIDGIEKTVQKYGIDCDFQRVPAYIYTNVGYYASKLRKEAAAVKSLGISSEIETSLQLPFDVSVALRFDNQAQFNPSRYLAAIAGIASKEGCQIYEHTAIIDIREINGSCILQTANGHTITAKYAVMASHYPFHDGGRLFFTRLKPERSYLIAVKLAADFPDGMYISAESPVRSMRTALYGKEKLLLIGGETHKTGHGKSHRVHFKRLMEFGRDYFKAEQPLFLWSAQDYHTPDGLPYAGFLKESSHILLATGFAKWGMTNSYVSADLIRELLTKGRSELEEVYSPSRLDPSGIGNLTLDNADIAFSLITGKLKTAKDPDSIRKGRAGPIKIDGTKYGAYRDQNGELHLVDTTCTHVGCELNFNDAEKTWDCPCHGSRFNLDGSVAEGPAFRPLGKPPHKSDIDPDIF